MKIFGIFKDGEQPLNILLLSTILEVSHLVILWIETKEEHSSNTLLVLVLLLIPFNLIIKEFSLLDIFLTSKVSFNWKSFSYFQTQFPLLFYTKSEPNNFKELLFLFNL